MLTSNQEHVYYEHQSGCWYDHRVSESSLAQSYEKAITSVLLHERRGMLKMY